MAREFPGEQGERSPCRSRYGSPGVVRIGKLQPTIIVSPAGFFFGDWSNRFSVVFYHRTRTWTCTVVEKCGNRDDGPRLDKCDSRLQIGSLVHSSLVLMAWKFTFVYGKPTVRTFVAKDIVEFLSKEIFLRPPVGLQEAVHRADLDCCSKSICSSLTSSFPFIPGSEPP